MTRGLTTAAEAAVQQEVVLRTVAVQLDFSSASVRVNASPADISIGGDVFLGLGGFGAISAMAENAEIKSRGISLTLSGVPRDLVAVALGEPYQGRAATVWEVVLDRETWLPVADPFVVFRGRMDTMDVAMGQSCTITLGVEDRLVDLERPRIRRYTDEDQQARYPGDAFFSFVPATTEKELVWPAASFFG